ncbi:2'-5' RNA ligase family protein [Candidatus Roizmanbacteria bacterium]|nr:2'-5' RNA ligase family protein [Candidatus Roizmanbacteria bacterium]
MIRDLSKKYKAPSFIPHLTIYGGGLTLDLDKAKKIISESIKDMQPFQVEVDKLNYSDNFWKTIFTEIKMNSQLQKIYINLRKELLNYHDYILKPHMSLIYKKLSNRQKEEIVNNIIIKNQFTLDKIAICSFEDHDKVDRWKLVFKLYLDKP